MVAKSKRSRRLWMIPMASSHHGLASTWMRDMQRLGWEMDESFRVTGEDLAIDLNTIKLPEWLHCVRAACQRVLLGQLQAAASHWKGAQHIDVKRSTATWRSLAQSSPLRAPLGAILTASVATPTLLFKAKRTSTATCQDCFHDEGSLQHILWHCPAWTDGRSKWPVKWEMISHCEPCVTTTLMCTKDTCHITEDDWKHTQLGAAQLILEWQHRRRAERGKGSEPPTSSMPTTLLTTSHTDLTKITLHRDQHGLLMTMRYLLPMGTQWQFGLPAWHQLHRFTVTSGWDTGVSLTWEQLWMGFVIQNAGSPVDDGFMHEQMIRGQVGALSAWSGLSSLSQPLTT